MAIPVDQTQISHESDIAFSEEVARAEASAPPPPTDPTYEWSNGRKFVEPVGGGGPYAP